jgi:hypothetical protein
MIVYLPGIEPDRVVDQIELRALYDMIPEMVSGNWDLETYFSEYAYGGLEYPELHLRNIPDEKKSELGKKLGFVRTCDRKIVKAEGRETEYTMVNLETGGASPVEDGFIERVESIESVTSENSVNQIEDQEEHVKKSLKKLGYI